MGLVFLIVIGGMLGWLAAIIFCAESGNGRLRNILVGIAGALATGLAVIPLIGGSTLLEGHYRVDSLLLALTGSVLLLLTVNLFRDWKLG